MFRSRSPYALGQQRAGFAQTVRTNLVPVAFALLCLPTRPDTLNVIFCSERQLRNVLQIASVGRT